MAGSGRLTAQQTKKSSDAQDLSAVKSALQQMSGQMDVPEVPESQRATRVQIDKLFEVMRLREQTAKVVDMASTALRAGIQQGIEQKKRENPNAAQMTPAQEEQLNAVFSDYMKKMIDVVYSDEVMGPLKASYQRYLSTQDVEGIIAFYQSPAGQHLLDKQVKIQLEGAPAMMEALQTKLKVLIEEMQKQIAALDLPADKQLPAKKTAGANK
jgi:hypothetical protein